MCLLFLESRLQAEYTTLWIRSPVYKNNNKKRRKGHRKIDWIITAHQRPYTHHNWAEGVDKLMDQILLRPFIKSQNWSILWNSDSHPLNNRSHSHQYKKCSSQAMIAGLQAAFLIRPFNWTAFSNSTATSFLLMKCKNFKNCGTQVFSILMDTGRTAYNPEPVLHIRGNQCSLQCT